MSMTLKQYRDMAIIKTSIEGKRLFPAARLNFMINKALKFVQLNLNGLGYKKWEAAKTYTTTASTGQVATVAIGSNAGTNYVTGDLVTIWAAGHDCVLTVTAGSGIVTALSIVTKGTGYSVASNIATHTNSTAGHDLTVSVLTLTSDGLLNATTFGSASTLSSNIPTDMMESDASVIMADVTDGSLRGTTKQEYSPGQFEAACGNSYSAPTVKESAYMRLANSIFVFPATITTMYLYYYKALVDLSVDTDTSDMPVDFEDFVVQRIVNDIKSDLGEIQDIQAANQTIANQISDTYKKAVITQQQRVISPTQREQKTIQ